MAERRKRRTRTRCPNCGVPEPFPEEWETVPEGGRPDLCWGDPVVCTQFASGEIKPSDPVGVERHGDDR